jgi:hypothetical protein
LISRNSKLEHDFWDEIVGVSLTPTNICQAALTADDAALDDMRPCDSRFGQCCANILEG